MSLTPIILKLVLIIIPLLFTTIGLVRVQPYDDSALRALLAPSEGCEMPCWQGIHFGVTSLDDAIALLRRSPWIGDVRKRAGYRHTWEWNQQRPNIISGQLPQYLFSWHEGTADAITIQNLPPLWQFWLVLGRPDTVTVAPMEDNRVLYIASYEAQQLHIFNFATCDQLTPEAAWQIESRLDIGRLVFYPVARPVTFDGSEWWTLFHEHPFC